jgi:chromosomal replication initiator protein
LALHRLQAGQLAEARRIRRAVAHHYGLRPAQLSAPGRHKELAEARQVAMYVMRRDLWWPTWSGNVSFPLTRIAALLGRDHATVAHGVGRIAAAQASDASLRWTLATIRATVDDEDEGEHGASAA